MKKVAIFLTVFAAAFASEEFNQALRLENNGKIKEAMLIYKKLALDAERKINPKDGNTRQIGNERSRPENGAVRLDRNSDENTDLASILGVKLYDLNYLLPVSVANKDIDGRKRLETKFQISLQKPLSYDIFGFNESIAAAYSQTSWWQTAQSSAPFRETNYRPELFISLPVNFNALPQLKTLNFGILHESNGQGGERSRSWNRLYAKGEFKFGDVSVTPRVWGRIRESSDDNPHITRYLGRADVIVTAPLGRHFLRLMLRNNLHLDGTNKGAAEIGWLFPLWDSGIYGYLQYFNGYGESLIDYDRRVNKISIGISVLK